MTKEHSKTKNNNHPHENRRVVSSRLPFPSSVYLFNGFYEDLTDTNTTTTTTTLTEGSNNTSLLQFIRDHSSSLLYHIRLEFIVLEQQQLEEPNNNNNSTTTSQENRNNQQWKEHILYSKTISSGTIQPVWHHLNEQIDPTEFSIQAYESMMIRFFVVNPEQQQQPPSLHDNPHGSMWQQVFIHPSKLVRIQQLPQPEQQHLPLNFIVIQYSDQSLRTTIPLYQLLETKGKKEEIQSLLLSVSSQVRQKNDTVEGGITDSDDDYFGRFKDNAFHVLDQVAVKEVRKRMDSIDDWFPPSTKTSQSVKETSSNNKLQHHPISDNVLLNGQRSSHMDIEKYISILRTELQEQELALSQEIQEIEDEYHVMKQWENQILEKEKQIRQIKDVMDHERYRGLEITLKLQTHQIRLVRELQQIYPISVFVGSPSDPRQRYRIRDLEFPVTLQDMLMASEDELSAVLGYTCHLVHMLSKYLSIQLRYRLLCHNSKSGIQDDRAIIYPLFYGRNVDKDQFEHGILLLQRNVDCFCRERGLTVAPKLHILGKLKRVCEHVVDGY